MRSAFLSDAFKRGLVAQFASKEVRMMRAGKFFPLFFKTFSSVEATSVEATTEALTKSRSHNLPNGLFWRVFDNPKVPLQSVLDGWLNDGKTLKKRDLQGLVRGLRTHHRYQTALQVSEWMQNNTKLVFTPGDHCIQLDLITKVYGIGRAEKHFGDLPKSAKNEMTYCALLNCYAREGLSEKTEHWMEKMKELGFATTVRPYNMLMNCYFTNGQFEKVLSTIKHLKKMDVQLDSSTYRLWINACASKSSIDDAEKIVDELKTISDDSVKWTAYICLANIYIKAGLVDKAESALKEAEKKVTNGSHRTYDHLITMYASIGNKEEVHRIWQSLKTSVKKLNNQDYLSVLSSLVKFGDIEGAEKIFNEWELRSSKYDFRVSNILLAAYVREGMLEKAESFHSHIVKERGEPICKTWEILAQGYLKSKQMDKAVTTMMKALSKAKFKFSNWKPRSENVMGILNNIEEQGNVESADAVLKRLRGIQFVTTEIYNSLLSTYAKAGKDADKIFEQMVIDKVSADEETDRLRKVINENKP